MIKLLLLGTLIAAIGLSPLPAAAFGQGKQGHRKAAVVRHARHHAAPKHAKHAVHRHHR